MSAYTVIDHKQIETNIFFIRIKPTDIKLTLGNIFRSMSNLTWINKFDEQYRQDAFEVRANETISYLSGKVFNQANDNITSETGEFVVSELSRLAVVNELSYLDIPLAELFKSQAVGNDGFDFFSRNLNKIILFGEAKYNSRQNAYGVAFEQIVRFEKIKQDVSDVMEITHFCCEESLKNHSNGKKGFIAAFASKTISTEAIISGIKRNANYKQLVGFEEIICVAVNV